jgi:hypothetical protein
MTDDSLTILRAHRRRLAKVIHPDGTVTDYDQVKTVDLIEQPITDLEALRLLLMQLVQLSDRCVVRGKPAHPERCKGVRRLLYADGDDAPTLVEVPRSWVAFDFDGLPRPDWIEPTDLLGCACVAIRKLPIEFHQAQFIVQATARHGIIPGLRLRLWAWLSRPVIRDELKYWLRNAPVDRSVFGPAQIIYTAAPVFLPGAADPLPNRIDVIPGDETVTVPSPKLLKPPSPPSRCTDREPHSNISGLIALVETARIGNRSNLLYWAVRRVAENPAVDRAAAAAELEAAAISTGLSAQEAAATVRSGLRGGSND